MKKIIATTTLLTFGISTPAFADTYVKVDANGQAIGSQIVCDTATCGDTNSLFSKLTLSNGERWVLQNTENWGIGGHAGLTYNFNTKIWTNTDTVTNTNKFTGVTETVTTTTKYAGTIQNPISTEVVRPVITNTTTVTNNDIDTLFNQLWNLVTQLLSLVKR